MNGRYLIWGGLAIIAIGLAGFAGWIASLPPAGAGIQARPTSKEEMQALLAALKPSKRQRPLIAVVGINDTTETTDYLMPTGILRRADVADVAMLATHPGPVRLFPALGVEPDATITEFDARNPEGADYVIVPAMSRDDDPAVISWLQNQARKGAVIVGVCAGAKVVGAAGLLDGKRATTHWYYLDEMLKRSPSIVYVADRRMVADRGVLTTTGITASMPTMLVLIEAIAGRAKAEAVAADLGIAEWDARHASGAFRFTRPFATTVLGNLLRFWNRDRIGVELKPGMDEVALALVTDAWSRTYRSSAVTFSITRDAVTGRDGIRVIPDETVGIRPKTGPVYAGTDRKPAAALDHALQAIGAKYGDPTANVVAMQLEYPR